MYINLCGFETGDMSEAYAYSNATVTASPRTGSYAMLCTPSSMGVNYAQFGKIHDTAGTQGNANETNAYVRFYFNFSTLPTSPEEIFVATTANAAAYKLSIRIDSFKRLYVYGGATGTTLLATGTTILSFFQWYCIEVKIGTNAVSAGPWELRINGNTEMSGVNDIHSNVNGLFILGKFVNRNSGPYNILFDDFAVRNDTWVGSGHVAPMLPNATGAEDFWAPSAGASFQCVDEVPTNNDTDYVSSNVVDDAVTVRFASGTMTGINCVKPIIFAREESDAIVKLRFRSDVTSSDTDDIALSTQYALYSRLYDVDPNTSSAWNLTDVNDAEAGLVYASGTSAARCTTIYLMVDYIGTEDYAYTTASGKLLTSGTVAYTQGYSFEPTGGWGVSGIFICANGFTHIALGSLRFSGESLREYSYCASGKLTFSGVSDDDLILDNWNYEASGALTLTGIGLSDSIRYLIQIGDEDKFQAIVLSDGATHEGSSQIVGFGYVSYNSDGSFVVDTQASLPTIDQWYHIALARDNSDINFYINGLLKNTHATALDPEYGLEPEVIFGTGLLNDGFDGDIDEIRVYSRVLTSDQVATLASGEDFSTASFSFTPTFVVIGRGRLRMLGSPALELYSFDADGGLNIRGIAANWSVEPIFVIGSDSIRHSILVANDYRGMYGFGFESGNVDSTDYFDSVGSMPTIGAWHHLALVREQGMIRFYVDGINVLSVPTVKLASFGISPKALLGKLLNYRLHGKVDDARLYLRPLTQTDVTNLAAGNDLSTASFEYAATFVHEASGLLRILSETSGDFVYNSLGLRLRLRGRASLARGDLDYIYEPTGQLVLKGIARVTSISDNTNTEAGPLRLSGSVQVNRATMRYNASGALRLLNVGQLATDFMYNAGGKLVLSAYASFLRTSFIQPRGKLRLTGAADCSLLSGEGYQASGKLGSHRIQSQRRLKGVASAVASPAFDAVGFMRLRGTAGVQFIDFTAIGGALRLSGSFGVRVRYGLVEATGALRLSGAADVQFVPLITYTYTTSGRLVVSGLSALDLLGADGVGTLRLSGIADVQIAVGYEPTGTLVLSGVAKTVAGLVFEPTGALILSDAGVFASSVRYHSSGKLVLSGTASVDVATSIEASGRLTISGSASLTGTAIFPEYLASGYLKLSGINKHATAFTYDDANGALFARFITGIATVETSATPFPVAEAGIPAVGLRSCSPGVTQHAFFYMLNPDQPIWSSLNDVGFDGWELICFNKKTREGTISIGDRTYVVKVPEYSASNKSGFTLPTVEERSSLLNRAALEPSSPQISVDLLSQQSVLNLLPDGSLKTYLQALSLSEWKVVMWDRANARVELQVQNRRISIVVQGATDKTPQKVLPTDVPTVVMSMAGPMVTATPPIARVSGGSGMALGISQAKFIHLVKNKDLKQLLTDLPSQEWQIKSFDRKTRKAELRVQNRYITIGV